MADEIQQMRADGRRYTENYSRWQDGNDKWQQIPCEIQKMTADDRKNTKKIVDDRTATTNDSRRQMRYNKCQQLTGEYILGCRGWDTRTPHLKPYRIVKPTMSSSQSCPNYLFGQHFFLSPAQTIMSNFAELIIGWFWVITKSY